MLITGDVVQVSGKPGNPQQADIAPAFAKHDAKVHCYGVNTCKGTSDCKTAKNDCKGLNDCKGHGFKEMTSKQCTAAGGSLKEI